VAYDARMRRSSLPGLIPALAVPLALALALAPVLSACSDDDAPPIDAATAADSSDNPDAGAAPADATPADARPPFGVPCGEAAELCTPIESQGCCTPPDGGAPACEPINGLCLGRLQSCDGAEDCMTPSSTCCDFGFGPSCTEPSECMEQQGGTVVCHYDVDCPEAQPHCCAALCSAEACP
jgi:hypothetical protein